MANRMGMYCAMAFMVLVSRPAMAVEEAGEDEEESQGLTALGKPLGAEIISLFVPPTRPQRPFVATRQTVFVFNDDKTKWDAIYSTPPGDAGISAICGYAKSSKALYIAHGKGIARTRDGGAHWDESAPDGYAERAGDLASLEVNPADRKEAIVAVKDRAWMTKDYGATWTTFLLPSSAETLIGLKYAGEEGNRIVAATQNALYASHDGGQSWVTLLRTVKGPRQLATCLKYPIACILSQDGIVRVFDLGNSTPLSEIPIQVEPAPQSLAIDSAGQGAIWLSVGKKIHVLCGNDSHSQLTEVREGGGPARNLAGHPREASGLFWTEADRVYYLGSALGDQSKAIAEAKPLKARLSASAANAGLHPQGEDLGTGKAQEIISSLMANEPPMEEVVAAALKYANYRPREVEHWKENVRRRNLLPQLAVNARERELPVARWDRVTNVDRFGVGTADDIHESDGSRGFGDYSVELRWDLGNLLFDRDELGVSEEARRRAEQRNALITQVCQLYYERLELLAEQQMNAGSISLPDQVRSALRLKQTTDILNQLCGGGMY